MHEAVVRPIFVERTKQPAGDLTSAIVDEAGAAILVAQQIVPKGQPVDGVILASREQLLHESGALVRGRIVHERVKFGRRGQQANQVEKNATCEDTIRDHLRQVDLL